MTEPERSMMYSTPTLDRRPRPPGALPHRTSYNVGNVDSPASNSTSNTETPLSRQIHTRKTTSTPATEKEVIGLGYSSIASRSTSAIIKDTTSHDIQPSPPPPYGPVPLSSIVSVSTPPTQDIDDDPLESLHTGSDPEEDEEEEQRRERAMNLAQSLGLDLLSPTKSSIDDDAEDCMDAEEIRKQLKAMKRRLKVRDHELVMAAQAADYLLKQHEDLVSALPSNVRGLLPQLHDLTIPRQSLPNREIGRVLEQTGSSSSSPVLDRLYDANTSPSNSPSRSPGKKLFRTVRTSDISKPFPHHHNHHAHAHARNIFNTPKRRSSFAETMQQESDERLILLERALAESRENEETQRKLAARLKRDFEKLQMDFDHAEQSMSQELKRPEAKSMDSTSSMESMTSSQFDSWAWKQTLDNESEGSRGILKPKATKLKLRIKARRSEVDSNKRDENDSTWGLTQFPEFPGDAESSIGDRLTRLPPRPTFNRLKAKLRQPSPTKPSPRHSRISSASDCDLPVPSPRKVETPSRSTRGRGEAGMSFDTFQSRGPSRSVSRSRSSPRKSETSPRNQTPLRGRYDSISSQLASVRKFVSNSVRSVGFNSRSLGSELGSEYGDDDLHRSSSETRNVFGAKDVDGWEDEEHTGSDGTEGPFSRPISIPANASQGLSSLAIALSCSPVKKVKTPRRSPTHSAIDEFDPGSYRPKKGRRNWIRPLLLSQRHDTRPAMYPRTSSDGTLALAHRRQKSSKEELYDLVQEICKKTEGERRGRQLELYSPPARLVNDLIILLSVLLEWIEMFIVIVYRVSVAVRYGRESIFRTWRQGRDKRYYL